MDYPVPSFGVEDDDPFTSALGFSDSKLTPNSGLAEIVWQDGPVSRRFPLLSASKNLSSCCSDSLRMTALDRGLSHSGQEARCELFMGEDEMASWLQCPIEDSGGVAIPGSSPQDDLGRPLPSHGSQENSVSPLAEAVVIARPTAPTAIKESTVAESIMTPPESRTAAPPCSSGVPPTCDNRTAAASSSGGTGDGDPRSEHGKRKAHELDDSEGEDAFDSGKRKDTRKPQRRSRAAEVHNLSERRRRDRINEKMKALQELIPRCNKSDKASMLDDAVEYLKSLQLQIQMMSMGCAMTPMMFPSFPQYIPTIGMGVEPTTGSLPYPMAPFSSIMPETPIHATNASQFSTRMPMHAFHPGAMTFNGQLQVPTNGQSELATNMIYLPTPNQPLMSTQTSSLPDPYCQFMGLQQLQVPHQGQTILIQEGTGKASNLIRKTDNSKQGLDG